jgi:hypothetical protein
MARLNRAERQRVIEQLSGWLRLVVEDEGNDIQFQVDRGLERAFADDLESMLIRPNGTSTLIVRINGGARATAAPDGELPPA